MKRSLRTSSCLIALSLAAGAHAAAPQWQVVLTPSSNLITLPGIPTPGSYEIALPGPVLSDSPIGNLNFVIRLANGYYNLWRELSGALQPYAQLGVTGSTGPGRTGAESGHVFRRLTNASTSYVFSDTNQQDARVFTGYAGAPAASLDNSPIGAWISTSAGNTEFARFATDGALGPALGAGWSFQSTGGPNIFGTLHALPNGAVLVQANVRSPIPPNLPYIALVRHQPGVGNVACSVTQSTNPAWAPGVLGTDFFESIRYASSSPRGEVYAAGNIARMTPIAVRNGIWQFCAGAPQLKAINDSTGALGPNIPGSVGAVFTSILPNIAPSIAGSFYFTGKSENTAPTFKGIFHHSLGSNRPVLLNGVEGAFGPQVAGFVFDTILEYDPIAAGPFGVTRATIRPVAGSTSTTGLWRLRPDGGAEPVAIIGNTGAFAPAPGRVWRDLDLFNIFENGDVIIQAASTNPPDLLDTVSVWRIRPGRAPEEILKKGDLVRTPTATGIVLRAVRGISRPGSGSAAIREYGGDDSWVSASGSALINVSVEPMEGLVFNTPWVRAQVTDLDVVLQDGFE